MQNRRCGLCGLYGCRHVNPRLPPELNRGTTTLTMGENVGEPMTDLARVPTIPIGTSPTAKEATNRVIIPPPPLVPKVDGITVGASLVKKEKELLPAIGLVDTSAAPIGTKEFQKIDMKTDWVHCNICKARVFVRYLDMHLKVHTHNFEPSAITNSSIGNTTSRAIVRTNHTGSSIITPAPSYSARKPEVKGPILSKIETYRYRQLDQACCASSVSSDGMYSDFTIIFWEKDRPGVVSTMYTGNNSSYTIKDWERFSIHIVYDSLEDYYMLTSKLLKRGQHSFYDSEEACPDKICEQSELFSEIKRALLFFRISPKAAYKHFRKLFKIPMVTEYDANGKAVITQSKNCEALQERLKKSSSSSSTGWANHGHHGWQDHEYD